MVAAPLTMSRIASFVMNDESFMSPPAVPQPVLVVPIEGFQVAEEEERRSAGLVVGVVDVCGVKAILEEDPKAGDGDAVVFCRSCVHVPILPHK